MDGIKPLLAGAFGMLAAATLGTSALAETRAAGEPSALPVSAAAMTVAEAGLPRFEPAAEAAPQVAAQAAVAPFAAVQPAAEPAYTPAGAGLASWYGAAHAGKRTASGERFDPAGLTAAHRTLPFGTRVRVTHEASGRSVIVRITDRGPFSHNRLIDVSEGAAKELGLVRAGSGRVKLELVEG